MKLVIVDITLSYNSENVCLSVCLSVRLVKISTKLSRVVRIIPKVWNIWKRYEWSLVNWLEAVKRYSRDTNSKVYHGKVKYMGLIWNCLFPLIGWSKILSMKKCFLFFPFLLDKTTQHLLFGNSPKQNITSENMRSFYGQYLCRFSPLKSSDNL